MQPTDQTLFGKDQGNCFPACIASILEIPLETIPNFCAEYGDDEWWTVTQRWIEENTMFTYIEMELSPDPNLAMFGAAYWIATGKSPRGDHMHAVVYCGDKMIHDPHPDKNGLVGDPTSAGVFTLARKM